MGCIERSLAWRRYVLIDDPEITLHPTVEKLVHRLNFFSPHAIVQLAFTEKTDGLLSLHPTDLAGNKLASVSVDPSSLKLFELFECIAREMHVHVSELELLL